MRHILFFIRCLMVVGGLYGPLALASLTTNDINPLLQSGKVDEAIATIDAALRDDPKDYNLLFMKAVVLAGKQDNVGAERIFRQLVKQFPERPEPMNNLAVLLARGGNYTEARNLLDQAMLTDPKYAQIQRNIGDLNANLAGQAYEKALKKSGIAKVAQLNFVRELPGQGSLAPIVVVKNVVPASEHRPVVRGVTTSLASGVIEGNKSAAVNVAPPAVPPTVAVVETAKPSAPLAEVNPPKKVPVVPSGAQNLSRAENEKLVLETIQKWAQAWSARDVAGYLNYYDAQFSNGGLSHNEWAEDRRLKILGKKTIQVEIQSPKVMLDGNKATVNFVQIYAADTLKARARKTLVLMRQTDGWKIIEERAQ